GNSVLVPVVLAAMGVVLIGAALLAARLRAPRVVSDGAAWAAITLVTLAAATVPPGGSPGAPHAFLAAVTAVAATWLLVRLTGRYWSAGAAVITAGAFAIAASVVRMYWAVLGP